MSLFSRGLDSLGIGYLFPICFHLCIPRSLSPQCISDGSSSLLTDFNKGYTIWIGTIEENMIIGELDRYIKAKCKELNFDVLYLGSLCGYSKRKWHRVRSGENHLKLIDLLNISRVISEESGEYQADVLDEIIYSLTIDLRTGSGSEETNEESGSEEIEESESEEIEEPEPYQEINPDLVNLVWVMEGLRKSRNQRGIDGKTQRIRGENQ